MKLMVNKKELEELLISLILRDENAFVEIAGCNPNAGIFDIPEHQLIFNDAMVYYREYRKAPNSADIYHMQLLANENRSEVKECLKHLLKNMDGDRFLIKQYLFKLIDMKAEAELKQYKSTESGLDYLQDISTKSLKIIEKYTAGIKKHKTNMEIAESLMQRITKGENTSNYIKTGFSNLDKHIIGIPKSHLTIIAGRPGTGKTTFMLQLFRNFMNQNLKVGIFSLEMTAESLLLKNLSAETQINSIDIDSGNISKADIERLSQAVHKYVQDNYVVLDNSNQNPALIQAQINSWKMKNAVDIIIIDYLTLINTYYKESRNDLEIGKLSRELNAIAKNTGLPIILLSQLNRQSESRTDKKPLLADLRESGSIEQDANLVMMLYRPFQYGIDGRSKDFKYLTISGDELSKEEYFEVIITKARNARTGSVALRYRPEIHTIEPVKLERFSGERVPEDYKHLLKAI